MFGITSRTAQGFIVGMVLVGALILGTGLTHWHPSDPLKFGCYLLAALLASPAKVALPGIEGTLSLNFVFTLLGIVELSLPETLLIGLASTLVQFYWKPARRVKAVQLVFNLSQVTVSSAIAFEVYRLASAQLGHGRGQPLALLLAAITHFACNTLATSTIIALTSAKPIRAVWIESYFWSFPYYMVGAASAGIVNFLNQHIGWQSSLLVLPPIYLMYRSYRLYLGKLETEKRHVEEVSRLHLRTIETLALAIEAKDETTGEHLQRVRVYAMEVGKELGLGDDEIEALRAASVLHDIGKLAVPEHIISKPGKLTPEEFEKMKIHPIVGAEILEQVHFPYPVVPIVRSHHEKWDGSGYPDGLVGESIPIGARILAAVDCLDALASDRQYRKALPLHEAMAKVISEAGTSFDPRVVAILERRYIELEKMATEQPLQTPPKLSTDVKVARGHAPAAGFAELHAAPSEPANPCDSSSRLSQAQACGRQVHDIARSSPTPLSAADVFSLLAVRLRDIVVFEALAGYCPEDEILIPQFVSGENCRLFSSLRIPLGEGLSGWVAQNHKAIVNGNPSVEPGYLNDPTKCTSLRSALAVPIEDTRGVLAVLALYRAGQDAFLADELRALELVADEIAPVLAKAPPKSIAASAGTGK